MLRDPELQPQRAVGEYVTHIVLRSTGLLLVCGLFARAAVAADTPADLQRLQQQRTQQQLELQLRMQQQQDRGARAPASGASDFQLRQLERDQQQRQQLQLLDDSRAAASRAGESSRPPVGDMGDERRGQAAAEQLNRFENERRFERTLPSAPAPAVSDGPF